MGCGGKGTRGRRRRHQRLIPNRILNPAVVGAPSNEAGGVEGCARGNLRRVGDFLG